MNFSITSILKWVLIGVFVSVPTATSFWTANKLQSRTSSSEDGVSRMEQLSTRLDNLKKELEALKDKPSSLTTKITGAETKYNALMTATDLKSDIDKKFQEGKDEVGKFVEKFIKERKDYIIYDKNANKD